MKAGVAVSRNSGEVQMFPAMEVPVAVTVPATHIPLPFSAAHLLINGPK